VERETVSKKMGFCGMPPKKSPAKKAAKKGTTVKKTAPKKTAAKKPAAAKPKPDRPRGPRSLLPTFNKTKANKSPGQRPSLSATNKKQNLTC
jgi:hypothetical protein